MIRIMVSETTPPTSQLHYERSGKGADVLMIHGWASSGRMWQPLMQALQADARCWSLDLAGFGQSPLPPNARPDVDQHLAWVIAFIEQHKMKPRMVIGHSMGGLLALKLAHARPDLAPSLVLMCPVVTGRFVFNANQVFTSQLWMMVSAKTEKFWAFIQSDSLAPVFGAPLYVEPALRERYVRDFQQARWDAAIPSLESLAQQSMQPYLAQIQQPALVIVGGRDFTVPPEEGRLAAGQMPHARLVEFPNAHHQPLDESPAQFIKLVRDFAGEIGLF
jgi:pimeloyl-[acyl-carrier protein] methyl ester esterase